MSREIRIAENAVEIMGVLLEMIHFGELPPLCTMYEKFKIGFSDLKEGIICLSEEFEPENTDSDWCEKDYVDEIRKFARRGLFALFYGENKIFYTETWNSYDIIAAADELDVCLNKKEIDEVAKRATEAFDDKSIRNEIIVNIVEDIVKERRKRNEN